MGKSKDLATGNSAAYVETAGDTMTGNLGIGAAPTSALSIEGSGFTDSTIRLKRTASGTNNDAGLQFTSAAGANSGYGMGGIWFKNSVDDNAYALIRARTDDSTGTSGKLDFITSDAAVGNSTASRMTINSSGYVTMPNQPSFSAYRDAGHVTAGNVFVFDHTNYNIGNMYNTSNGKATVPVDGRYFLGVWLMSQNDATYNNDYFRIRINNASPAYKNVYTSSGGAVHHQWSWAGVINLNANDFVEIYIDGFTAYGTNGLYSNFSMHLLS